jgi:hypothetical protein
LTGDKSDIVIGISYLVKVFEKCLGKVLTGGCFVEYYGGKWGEVGNGGELW